MDDGSEDVMSGLIEESREHLGNIEPDFLTMEEEGANTPPDLINRVFRAMHSIKGGFGFFGKKNIVELAHVMENILMKVRDGDLEINDEMVGALLDGTDTLRVMVDDVDGSDSMDISDNLSQLQIYTEGSGEASSNQKKEEAKQASQNFSAEIVSLVNEKITSGTSVFQMIYKKDHDVNAIKSELATVGELLHEDEARLTLLFATVMDLDMIMVMDIPEGVKVDPVEKIESQKESPETEAAVKKEEKKKAASPVKSKTSSAQSSDSIRVRTDLLSQLMDTTGELVLGRNHIMDLVDKDLVSLPGVAQKYVELNSYLSESQEELLSHFEHSSPEDIRNKVKNQYTQITKAIDEILHQKISDSPGVGAVFQSFSQVSSDLQNKIMSTRLQPVSTVFSKFPRVIRDMNKKLGKEIELVIEGGEVELDKSVIEGLGDPLTHIIRNSADHGVEAPDKRESLGKSRKGTVKLIARHEGGQVQIIIQDDGAGVNIERVKEKAVENGLMSNEEADALSDKEAVNLIFAAGFSTAAVVSDVSGRGVGMDVVRTNIEKLGGRIDLESVQGQGSTLKLILPLTLAIIPSLGVRLGESRYAIPQTVIEELVRVETHEVSQKIATVSGSPVLKLRELLLPLVRLSDVMQHKKTIWHEGESFIDRRNNLADRRSEEILENKEDRNIVEGSERKEDRRKQSKDKFFIVVVKALGSRFGLVVDQLDEPQEVVVKPLSGKVKDLKIYSGATICSDGEVSMILDVDGIARDSEVRLDNNVAEKVQKHALINEAQTMMEFKAGTEDRFAVNLSMVSRIEEIDLSNVHKTGKQDYLKYEDSSLPVIWLHEHLPVNKPEKESKKYFVLVPRLVPVPIGIIIDQPLDVFESNVEIDSTQVSGDGFHGSLVIDGRMILFLDLYGLFEKAAPELHGHQVQKRIDLSTKKVILAEDTSLFRTVIGKFLKSLGFETVDIVNDGVQAWQKMQEESYDLVVTDIVMPEMDGMELARTIRSSSEYKDIPIIAVTSLLNESDKQKILASGINAYEQKLQKQCLAEAVYELLGKEVLTV